MKVKDIVLAGLITLNLALLILVAAVTFFGHETPVVAGAVTDNAGYFRACTARVSESREALVIIDTVSNRLNFYVNQPGQPEFKLLGTPIDLAKAFQHSTP